MKYLPIVLGAGILVAAALIFRNAPPPEKPAAQETFDQQTNAEGPVTVAVTSQISSSEWKFDITLDTHSIELGDDMAQVSRLIDNAQNEYAPVSWEGDQPGGHHREGVLAFAPIAPAPDTITLVIRGVGNVPERRFTWPRSD